MEIKVKYHSDISPLEYISVGNWIDLRAGQDIFIPHKEFAMIPLGVSMQLPEGYEAIIAPRSSTFARYGIILVNGIGIIDSSYCGDNDIWQFPAYCLELRGATCSINGKVGTWIARGDRIAQFRILPRQPQCDIVTVDQLGNQDRGGFGSTGR